MSENESFDRSRLLTTDEMMVALGLSRGQICKYCASGAIKACRVGRSWVATREALDDFVQNRYKRGGRS